MRFISFSKRTALTIAVCLLLILAIAVIAIEIKNASKIDENALLQPKAITADHSLNKTTVDQMVRDARLYYTFWNTGETKYLDAVMGSSFIDHTLPTGRPQGPDGIKIASSDLRKSFPDLQCAIEELIITDNKIIARVVFSGTFLGEFMGHQPTGKPVKFTFIDILHPEKDQIIDEWHAENNSAFL